MFDFCYEQLLNSKINLHYFQDSFIPSIVNFESGEISEEIRMEMTEKYLSKPDYTYEKVMRYSSMASKLIVENRFWAEPY